MVARKCTDDDLIAAVNAVGVRGAARQFDMAERNVFARVARLRAAGVRIDSPLTYTPAVLDRGKISLKLHSGQVVSASDCHYWPGPKSLMHRALVHFLKSGIVVPDFLILNGDVVDMGTISRFPDVDWEKRPTVQQELEVADDRLMEIRQALKRHCRTLWTCGNHDSRFQRYIIERAPELAKVKGTHLRDHFPLWETAWDVHFNEDAPHPGDRVVVKHRFKGGIHHAYNDTLHSGRTMVTGDKHAAQVTNFTDLNGTRWGVDNGCIADPRHVAFAYGENNPRNWRDSFAVLTFEDGRLLPPQLVYRWGENAVAYLGQVYKIPAETDHVRRAGRVDDGLRRKSRPKPLLKKRGSRKG